MMQALRKLFKPSEPEKKLPTGDMAWSESSAIYNPTDFTKYNPDSLIGVKGFAIYKRMMRDEQVKAAVKFKRDAITSRDFTFELDHEQYGISEEEAKRRIDLSYTTIDNMNGSWMDALNGVMSGMQNGFSMTEKLFQLIDFDKTTYWGIDQLKIKPFDTFQFRTDEYGNITGVVQKLGSKEQEVDLDKFIHFVMNPDVDEHYGQSELRECYRAWFNKDVLIKLRTMWLERHAGGFRWMKVTEGMLNSNSQEYRDIQNVLQNINTQTGLILPSNIEMGSEYPANNAAFKEAIEDQDVAIARALLVPNLLGVSPQGNTGSYSQSTNQLEAFLWTLEADTLRLEDALNEQLFKQLGEVNFADGCYPRFKMKPASKSKMMELVNTWKDLVSAGAVTHNNQDEIYLRELLDMPTGTAEDESEVTATKPDTALNGAQVSSMVQVVEKIALGILTKEAAAQILVAAFPLSVEQANAIVKDVEVKEIEPNDESQNPPNNKNNNGNSDGANNPSSNSDANDDGNNEQLEASNKDSKQLDETVWGMGQVTVSAFSKAEKRVDFAVIDKTSGDLVNEHTTKVLKSMDLIVTDLIDKAKFGNEQTDNLTDNIKTLKPRPKLKRDLNNSVSAMLEDAHSLGLKHAQREIDKAKGDDFSRKFNKKRMKFIADDFFTVTSFKVTGNLTDDAISLIESIILNGARYDWPWERIENEIYLAVSKAGLISYDLANEALQDALGSVNPQSRIDTMVRTNTFDAINTARYDYFTDPALDGFVTAFEYSAIMDGRTTSICKHLEGGAGDHSVEWYAKNPEYRPPNHYNCRSILIPVTAIDEGFKEGNEPTVKPHVGFGGSE